MKTPTNFSRSVRHVILNDFRDGREFSYLDFLSLASEHNKSSRNASQVLRKLFLIGLIERKKDVRPCVYKVLKGGNWNVKNVNRGAGL